MNREAETQSLKLDYTEMRINQLINQLTVRLFTLPWARSKTGLLVTVEKIVKNVKNKTRIFKR